MCMTRDLHEYSPRCTLLAWSRFQIMWVTLISRLLKKAFTHGQLQDVRKYSASTKV